MVTLSDCVEWYEAGNRRWHNSVDVPGDIEKCERDIAMESVVGLSKALDEIICSDISDWSKGVSSKVFTAMIDKWLECLN